MDYTELVREGYETMGARYLEARRLGVLELPILDRFVALVPPGGVVLDAACGAGIPVTRALAVAHRVIAADISFGQLRLARRFVPQAGLACQDTTQLGFAAASLDGYCCCYGIIHVPRAQHEGLLRDVHRLLKHGAHALLCLGAEDLEAEQGDYLGAPMYWSHFDSQTYHAMLSQTGFRIIDSCIVPDPIDGGGVHLFVLVAKDRGRGPVNSSAQTGAAHPPMTPDRRIDVD
jgi:SAM-dependent methyltransferase